MSHRYKEGHSIGIEPGCSVISMPAGRAARRVAYTLLDKASKTVRHLEKKADAKSIHDVRVSLRRLRTFLKAFRSYLGDAASKKILKHLRKLAKSAAAARDKDVGLLWLISEKKRLPRKFQTGCRWLIKEFRKGKTDAYSDLGSLGSEFRDVRKKIEKGLKLTNDEPSAELFSTAVEDIIADLTRRLNRRMEVIISPQDAELIHKARISAKALRYVLEPVAVGFPRGRPILSRLKKIQTVLGDLHDMHVMEMEITACIVKWTDKTLGEARKSPPAMPGLLELEKRVRKRQVKLFSRFHNLTSRHHHPNF